MEAERRRRWSVEEKLRVVRETLEPGVVTKVVAERHGISTGLLYAWRKQMLTTAMAGFVPVRVAPEAAAPMLWSSGVRVRVGSGVDVKLLRSVLAELSSR